MRFRLLVALAVSLAMEKPPAFGGRGHTSHSEAFGDFREEEKGRISAETAGRPGGQRRAPQALGLRGAKPAPPRTPRSTTRPWGRPSAVRPAPRPPPSPHPSPHSPRHTSHASPRLRAVLGENEHPGRGERGPARHLPLLPEHPASARQAASGPASEPPPPTRTPFPPALHFAQLPPGAEFSSVSPLPRPRCPSHAHRPTPEVCFQTLCGPRSGPHGPRLESPTSGR